MGFLGLGSKKQAYLGIDIGGGGIKLVELQNEGGRAKLQTYGFTERLPGAEPYNLVDDPIGTGNLIKKIAAKARATTTKAFVNLPVASVFSSVITVSKGNEKELREAVMYQAKKLIPVPLEEMVVDFKEIQAAAPRPSANGAAAAGSKSETESKDGKKDGGKTVQVLLTGASSALVQKYKAVFKQAGLEIASLEPEAFALIRSLVGKDRATTLIVDIGAIRTNIIIVDNGVPYVTRSLDMGGVSLTRAMSKALALDLPAAEQMKLDIKSLSTIYPDDGLPKVFESVIAPMITELQYSMTLYAGQVSGPQRNVEKVILTGGTAGLPALAPHFAKQLGIKTYVGDPWARVVHPAGLRPALDTIGPRYPVAIGLAMSDIE